MKPVIIVLASRGLGVFWIPKPSKITPQDTPTISVSHFLKCQFQNFKHILVMEVFLPQYNSHDIV